MKKLLMTLCLALTAASGAQAQVWPAKPVTLLVPFPPGGSTDMIARTLGTKLQEKLGASFIVDNKAGAGGTVGAALAKRAAPDGYTIFVSSLGPFVIGPHLLKNLGYDPLKDFDYITVAVQAPNVLAVPANSPHKSVSDVLAFHKANPGKMSFASSGNGSSDHLTAELFWQMTGTNGLHIPYKGGAPAMSDLLGGQVEATFMNINTGITNIKAGKLRALAVTSKHRAGAAPDLPTLDESGLKGFESVAFNGMVAPAKTPRDIIAKINADAVKGINSAETRERLKVDGSDPVGSTPEQFASFIKEEITKWARIIKLADIKAE